MRHTNTTNLGLWLKDIGYGIFTETACGVEPDRNNVIILSPDVRVNDLTCEDCRALTIMARGKVK